MEKKNTGLVVLVVILSVLVIVLGGYIIYDKVLSNDTVNTEDGISNNDNLKDKNIKIYENLEYVYDASYSYNNKYSDFYRGFSGQDKVVTISIFGLTVEYRDGMQYLSDLKVPYINIKSNYAENVNSELEKLYKDYAKEFDRCAEDKDVSCTQILTYRTYTYNDILSVIVIYAEQATSKWVLNYNVYNFDLTDGNEITYSDMVTMLDYDKNNLLTEEKELLKNKMNDLWGKNIDLNTGCSKDNKNCYDIANEKLEESINNNSILFFVNNDGNLNILVIPYFDGVQNGDVDKYLIEVTKQ